MGGKVDFSDIGRVVVGVGIGIVVGLVLGG